MIKFHNKITKITRKFHYYNIYFNSTANALSPLACRVYSSQLKNNDKTLKVHTQNEIKEGWLFGCKLYFTVPWNFQFYLFRDSRYERSVVDQFAFRKNARDRSVCPRKRKKKMQRNNAKTIVISRMGGRWFPVEAERARSRGVVIPFHLQKRRRRIVVFCACDRKQIAPTWPPLREESAIKENSPVVNRVGSAAPAFIIVPRFISSRSSPIVPRQLSHLFARHEFFSAASVRAVSRAYAYV